MRALQLPRGEFLRPVMISPHPLMDKCDRTTSYNYFRTDDGFFRVRFSRTKQLRVFRILLVWMLVHRRVTPSSMSPVPTVLDTRVGRESLG